MSEAARAGLGGADHTGASLLGASRRGADLRGASLRYAYLIGADLRGADLRRADLTGADCRGADLLSVVLGRHAWPLIGKPSRWGDRTAEPSNVAMAVAVPRHPVYGSVPQRL